MFLDASPMGRVKAVNKLAKTLADKYGVENIKISDEIISKLSKETDSLEVEKLQNQAKLEIWEQIPVTFREKANAWRYMSMLLNPKTHLRNIVGNALFMPARSGKN